MVGIMLRRDEHGRIKSYCELSEPKQVGPIYKPYWSLYVAGECQNGMDRNLEELLNRYDANIIQELWQSSVNYYILYDYEPFDNTLFLKRFEVTGSKEYLTWLESKINEYLDNQEHLEALLLLEFNESSL